MLKGEGLSSMRRLAFRIALFIRFEVRQCPMAPRERNPGWP